MKSILVGGIVLGLIVKTGSGAMGKLLTGSGQSDGRADGDHSAGMSVDKQTHGV